METQHSQMTKIPTWMWYNLTGRRTSNKWMRMNALVNLENKLTSIFLFQESRTILKPCTHLKGSLNIFKTPFLLFVRQRLRIWSVQQFLNAQFLCQFYTSTSLGLRVDEVKLSKSYCRWVDCFVFYFVEYGKKSFLNLVSQFRVSMDELREMI